MKIDIEKAKDTKGVKIYNTSRLRESITAAANGFKQGFPAPEFKASENVERMEQARAMLKKIDGSTDPKEINETINLVYDLLDDGKLNQSRKLPAKTRKLITRITSFIPAASYLIYAILSGDFDLSQLWVLIGI